MAGPMYKNYLRLCERWGVDATKKGRDLGEAIRQRVAKEFSQGEASHIPEMKECEKKLESLNRLASNYHGKKYMAKVSSASGLSLEQCKIVVSTEGLKELKESELNILQRVQLWFQRYSS